MDKFDPNRFLEEQWEDIFGGWMADSRVALADSLLTAVNGLKSTSHTRAVELASLLLSDGVFAVRRSAARTLASLDEKRLEKICESWINSGSIVLRVRAAEAAAWLPVDDVKTLDNKFHRSLRSDPERRVRDAAYRSSRELRRRLWSAEHFRAVTSGDPVDPNAWVLSNYASGAALANIGDDSDLKSINQLVRQQNLPPNVRHWLERVANDLDRQPG